MSARAVWVSLLVSLIGLGCGPSTTLSPDQTQTVRIGLIVPLTGDLGPDGEDRRDGAGLAIREVNAAGGVLPARRIELFVADSASTVDRGVMVARDLAAANVVAIIGDAASSSTLEILREVTQPLMIPHVSGHSTSSRLTEFQQMRPIEERWFFRTVPDDAAQGPALAQAMFDEGCRNLGIAYVDNDYGAPLADSLRQAFMAWSASVAMGGIFAEVILPEGVASYPSEAATLAAAVPTDPTLGPSCVALIAYSASGGRFLRSWADLPPGTPMVSFFGADALRRPGFVDEAGSCDLVRGFRGTAPITDPASPSHNEFVDRFQITFDRDAASVTSPAYDAAAIMLLAIAAAGSTDPAQIRAQVVPVSSPPGTVVGAGDLATALRLIRAGEDIDYDGASGPVDVDEVGNVAGNYELWRYDGAMPCASTPLPSEFVRVAQIFPRTP